MRREKIDLEIFKKIPIKLLYIVNKKINFYK